MPTFEIDALVDEIRRQLAAEDRAGLRKLLGRLSREERTWCAGQLCAEDQQALLRLLGPEAAADLLENIARPQAIELIEELSAPEAARVADEMRSDRRADLLQGLPPGRTNEILDRMDSTEAQDARRLLGHRADSAGGLMVTEMVRYPADFTVGQVLEDLQANARAYSDYEVQYVYLVDERNVLAGVARLRDLIFAGRQQPVRACMLRDPHRVRAESSLDQLRRFFEEHAFLGAPVVDAEGRLLGVVHRLAVERAVRERSDSLLRKLSGIVGGEEHRSMPLRQRTARRLSWLCLNILLNVLAASVIAIFEETLAAVIALAVFLPIISDMSGASGSQAVAVSLRELSLGLTRPRDLFWVLYQELRVGVLNGIAVGLILALLTGLWQKNLWLSLVVGSALAINTVFAVLLGGAIPLALRRLRLDPALASAPILTTFTDMGGFLLVLGMASQVLPRLTA